jgi:sulfide:quinone oxidoreductase
MRPEEIPGLSEHAITVWTPEEMLRLRHGFARMVEKARSGGRHRLLFLIPPNNRCSGPMYELILMTDTWLRTEGVRGSGGHYLDDVRRELHPGVRSTP